jgi:hypothetical protein
VRCARTETVRGRQSWWQKLGCLVGDVQPERSGGIAKLDSYGAVLGISFNGEPAGREFAQLELAILADPLSVYCAERARSPLGKGGEPPRVLWRLRCFGLRHDYRVTLAS